MSTIEDNKRVAREFVEAFSNCDFDKWGECLAEDAIYEFPGTALVSGTFTKQEMVEKCKGIPHIFPDGIKLTIRNLTAEEDRLSMEAKGDAVSFEGVPYNNDYHMFFRLRDGKIIEAREYVDTILADKLFGPFMPKS